MSCTYGTIKFKSIGLMVLIAWFFINISSAVAADNWFQSGYKALAELLNKNKIPKRNSELVRLKNDGQPLFLRRFPGEQSAISARLSPPIRSVEISRGCLKEWCHVRIGAASGWLKKDRLDPYTPDNEQEEKPPKKPKKYVTPQDEDVGRSPPSSTAALPQQDDALPERQIALPERSIEPELVEIPLPVRKRPVSSLKKLALLKLDPIPQPKIETQNKDQDKEDEDKESVREAVSTTLNRKIIENLEVIKPRQNTVVTSLKLSDIKKQKYALTRLKNVTFLPVREDHTENARILGGIPFFADDVEALGLCIDEWCLVKRGTLRGWIKRHHLSEASEIETPRLQLKNTVGDSKIAVFTKPDEKADITSYLMHPATGIVPIGACDQEWCNIRYSDATGWISSKHLERQ